MSISISRNSWHFKLHKAFEKSDLAEIKIDNCAGLCDYFWFTVFRMILLPALLFFRIGCVRLCGKQTRFQSDDRRVTFAMQWFCIGVVVLLLALTLYVGLAPLWFLIFYGNTGGLSLVGSIFALLILLGIASIVIYAKNVDSIFFAYLRALKEKHCPRISFSE